MVQRTLPVVITTTKDLVEIVREHPEISEVILSALDQRRSRPEVGLYFGEVPRNGHYRK
jgi:hypothetical protein